jgi:hypothetical protein
LREADYLFITYIVTSKPKRISVAAGVVHIIILQNFVFEPDEMPCSCLAIMPSYPTNTLLLFMNAP